jgi:ribosomal protein S12 methylthiotransferase accessory factor
MPFGMHTRLRQLEVVGSSAVANSLLDALAKRGVRTTAEGDSNLGVVCWWPNVDVLLEVDRLRESAWVTIEDAGTDAVAVGPLFGINEPACVRCYMRRRRANHGREFKPAISLTAQQTDQVAQTLCRVIDGESSIVRQIQVLIDAQGRSHELAFLPVPGCERCWNPLIKKRHFAIEKAVDSRIGLVSKIERVDLSELGRTMVRALGASTIPLNGRRAMNSGVAADANPENALFRAIGESLERYASAFELGPHLTAKALGKERLVLDPQHDRIEDEWEIRWVAAKHVGSHIRGWAPCQSVYLPYRRATAEANLGVQSSCGLAAGRTLADAIRHGVEERIERDAFMRAWRGRVPVERVLARQSIPGLSVVRLPAQGELHVAVALIERATPPYTSVGAAARADLAAATKAAVDEAIVTQRWLEEWIADEKPAPATFPPRTLVDHARVHATLPALRASRELWINPKGGAVACNNDKRVFVPPNDTWYVELTTPDLALLGVSVVRVLTPGLLPLDQDALNPKVPGDSTPHPLS